MKALKGKAHPGLTAREEAQRRGLLAKIHIAKKQLGLDDGTYRAMLTGLYAEVSSGDLSIGQMEDFLKRFEELGWRGAKRTRLRPPAGQSPFGGEPEGSGGQAGGQGQTEALRERAVGIAAELENGEKRLDGLVRKICRVDCLEWCKDIGKLKRLLAALGKIRNNYNA